MAASGLGEITYNGRYGYRLVNRKRRGGIAERNRAHEWLRNLKLNVGAADKFVPQIIFTAPEPSVRLFLQALFSGDGSIYHSDGGVFLEYYSKSRRLIEDVHHLLLRFGIFSLIREKTTAIGTRACKIQITDKDQILRFAQRIGFSPGSVKQRLLEEKVLPMIAAQPSRFIAEMALEKNTAREDPREKLKALRAEFAKRAIDTAAAAAASTP